MQFQDRTEAGQRLASELRVYSGRTDVLVLALPRGGVPVGFEVAKALNAPLDVFLVRKLGVPGQRELAMGAIAAGGVRVLNEELVRTLGIPTHALDAIAAEEERELARRELAYRAGRQPIRISGRTAILVDDGIATGSTMAAAVIGLRTHRPARIIIAVPVAPPSTCDELAKEVDELVCLLRPEFFYAIGQWYQHFDQVTDNEVQELLLRSSRFAGKPAPHRTDAA